MCPRDKRIQLLLVIINSSKPKYRVVQWLSVKFGHLVGPSSSVFFESFELILVNNGLFVITLSGLISSSMKHPASNEVKAKILESGFLRPPPA